MRRQMARAWANIEAATRDGKDVNARLNMMSASMQGALAFQKGLGAVHSLSHPLGGHSRSAVRPACTTVHSTPSSCRRYCASMPRPRR